MVFLSLIVTDLGFCVTERYETTTMYTPRALLI